MLVLYEVTLVFSVALTELKCQALVLLLHFQVGEMLRLPSQGLLVILFSFFSSYEFLNISRGLNFHGENVNLNWHQPSFYELSSAGKKGDESNAADGSKDEDNDTNNQNPQESEAPQKSLFDDVLSDGEDAILQQQKQHPSVEPTAASQ